MFFFFFFLSFHSSSSSFFLSFFLSFFPFVFLQDNDTALDLARRGNHQACIELLQKSVRNACPAAALPPPPAPQRAWSQPSCPWSVPPRARAASQPPPGLAQEEVLLFAQQQLADEVHATLLARQLELEHERNAQMQACNGEVKRLQRELAAACRAAEETAKLWTARLQELGNDVQAAQQRLQTANARLDEWKQGVARHGVAHLTVDGVSQLLQVWGLDNVVSARALTQHQVSGAVLDVLSEQELTTELGMTRLGDRRRLTLALQRVREGGGVDRPPQPANHPSHWDTAQVLAWLRQRGLEGAQNFEQHAIDGEVLCSLTRDDLAVMNIGTLGDRARICNAIAALRPTAAAAPTSPPATAPFAAEADASVPSNFICPITHEIMQDPVILVDSGHTFERLAIEAWLARINTNPLTGAPTTATLIPNHALRGVIEEFLALRK